MCVNRSLLCVNRSLLCVNRARVCVSVCVYEAAAHEVHRCVALRVLCVCVLCASLLCVNRALLCVNRSLLCVNRSLLCCPACPMRMCVVCVSRACERVRVCVCVRLRHTS